MDKNGNVKYAIPIVVVLTVAAFGFGGRQYFLMHKEITKSIDALESTVVDLEEENLLLAKNLNAEKKKNDSFEGQIKEIAGTVGTLDKLAKTDKELLQKYSKVFFLNEHYIPDSLTEIPKEYNYEKNKTIEFHAKAWPYLESLLKAAKDDGMDLKIISGYRSFGTQSSLKNQYTVVYGSGANKFSADQGYSEHQLGTALDFTTSETGTDFNGFEKTPEYKWLVDNAYKYGFIISYPKENTYYQSEPWHWRFVGTNLAKRLHEDNQYFYNLDQPTIDLYLINIFG